MILGFIKKYFPISFFVLSLIYTSKILFLKYYPDFPIYYHFPQVVFSGGNPYVVHSEFWSHFIYPPPVLIFGAPFLLFNYSAAEKIWAIISICSIIASLYFILKMYGRKFFSGESLILSGIIFFTYFPLKFTLGMGQINNFILLLIVLCVYYLHKKKYSLSGIFYGISILLKIFPIFWLIYFLFVRNYKVLIASIVTVAIGYLVTSIILGPKINLLFIQNALPNITGGWQKATYYNQALGGFLTREIVNVGVRTIFKNILTVLLVILAFFAIFKNSKKDLYPENLKLGTLVGIFLLVNSFSWQHHFVWLLLPFFCHLFLSKKLKT